MHYLKQKMSKNVLFLGIWSKLTEHLKSCNNISPEFLTAFELNQNKFCIIGLGIVKLTI